MVDHCIIKIQLFLWKYMRIMTLFFCCKLCDFCAKESRRREYGERRGEWEKCGHLYSHPIMKSFSVLAILPASLSPESYSHYNREPNTNPYFGYTSRVNSYSLTEDSQDLVMNEYFMKIHSFHAHFGFVRGMAIQGCTPERMPQRASPRLVLRPSPHHSFGLSNHSQWTSREVGLPTRTSLQSRRIYAEYTNQVSTRRVTWCATHLPKKGGDERSRCGDQTKRLLFFFQGLKAPFVCSFHIVIHEAPPLLRPSSLCLCHGLCPQII